MPYASIDDLPAQVKDHLPRHAQEIFRSAFNNAVKEYHNEGSAFRVAWAAVERDYHKDAGGRWIKRA